MGDDSGFLPFPRTEFSRHFRLFLDLWDDGREVVVIPAASVPIKLYRGLIIFTVIWFLYLPTCLTIIALLKWSPAPLLAAVCIMPFFFSWGVFVVLVTLAAHNQFQRQRWAAGALLVFDREANRLNLPLREVVLPMDEAIGLEEVRGYVHQRSGLGFRTKARTQLVLVHLDALGAPRRIALAWNPAPATIASQIADRLGLPLLRSTAQTVWASRLLLH